MKKHTLMYSVEERNLLAELAAEAGRMNVGVFVPTPFATAGVVWLVPSPEWRGTEEQFDRLAYGLTRWWSGFRDGWHEAKKSVVVRLSRPEAEAKKSA